MLSFVTNRRSLIRICLFQIAYGERFAQRSGHAAEERRRRRPDAAAQRRPRPPAAGPARPSWTAFWTASRAAAAAAAEGAPDAVGHGRGQPPRRHQDAAATPAQQRHAGT